MKKYLLMVMAVTCIAVFTSAQAVGDYRNVGNNTWSTLGNWQTWNGATWVAAVSLPSATSPVMIRNDNTVTVDVNNAVCGNLQIGSVTGGDGAGTLLFNLNSVLSVTGSVTLGNTGSGTRLGTITMTAGGALNISSNLTIQGDGVSAITQGTGSNLDVTGNVNIAAPNANNIALAWNVNAGTANVDGTFNMAAPTADNRDCNFVITTGAATLTGAVTMNGTAARNSISITGAGTLNLGNTISAANGTFNPGASNSVVNYNGGSQTIRAATYETLVLSGFGVTNVKTFPAGVTATDVLNIQGTSTVAGTTPGYGGSAILFYAGSIAQVTSNVEFPSNANVDVSINNASGVTLNASKATFVGTLTVNPLCILNLSTFNLSAPTSVTLYGGATTGSVISGSGTLTLAGNISAFDNTGGTSGATISCPVALGGNRVFTVDDDGTTATDLTISGIISGANTISKSGTGKLVLSGLNTYTGTTTITAGILGINTLQNVSGGASSLGAPTTVANGTIAIAGGTTLQYTGAGNTSNRLITLTGTGAILDASGSSGLILSGNIGGNTFGLVLTGTGTGTLSGVIGTTSGTLTKNGVGAWTLSGLNTYTGKTTINAGTLVMNTLVNVNSGASSLGAPTTVANGTIDIGATGVLSFVSNAGQTSNRVINLTGDGATISADANTGLFLTGGITGSGFDLVLSGNGAGSGTESGIIATGNASVTKNGSAGWTLSGANTFTGGFTLNNGIILIQNPTALGTVAGTFTINGGAIDNNSGGSITTVNYPMVWNNNIAFGGNNSLNLGTGPVSISTDIYINTGAAGTTLTVGGVINEPSVDIQKFGLGTFSLGANPVTLNKLDIDEGTWISTSGSLVIKGEFGNNGTFTHNSGTVNFNTSGYGYIFGNADITFNNMIVSNTNITGVELQNDITVNGVFTLTSGMLYTDAVNLLNMGASSSTPGGSVTSHVTGPMRKFGNTNFIFPVGNGTLFRPIEISSLSGSAGITAQYFSANPRTAFGTMVAGGLNQVSACEYWTLAEGSGGITGIVKLNFGGSCNAVPYVTNAAALRVAHWSGAQWDNLGNDGTATLTSVKSTIASNFSPFTIGTTNGDLNPLPVKISSIRAYEKAAGVQIDWTAYNEDNLLNYIVERSSNGIDFAPLGSVAARNQPGDQRYGFFDATPLQGVNFYRLKNIDLDAKFGYSNIVKVNLDRNNTGITLYPNPVSNGVVSFQSSNLAKGNYTIKLLNVIGQQVYVQQFTHAGGAINQTIQLPAGTRSGMYTMQLETKELKVMSKAFMVQ